MADNNSNSNTAAHNTDHDMQDLNFRFANRKLLIISLLIKNYAKRHITFIMNNVN